MTWLIRSETKLPSGATVASYWFGPKSLWGSTYGPPKLAAHFKTKAMAETNIANTQGRNWRRRGRQRAQRLEEAIAEYETHVAVANQP